MELVIAVPGQLVPATVTCDSVRPHESGWLLCVKGEDIVARISAFGVLVRTKS